MARESTAIVGSGLNPLKKDVCANSTTGERYLAGTNVNILNPEDSSAGCSGLVTAVTLGTSAVQLPTTPLKYRRAISICNNSSTAVVYIGFDPNVTTGTGWPLAAKATISLDINGQVLIYGVASVASTDVRILELS